MVTYIDIIATSLFLWVHVDKETFTNYFQKRSNESRWLCFSSIFL